MRKSADGRRWTRPRLIAGGGTDVGANFPKVLAGLRPGVFELAWEDDRDGPADWNVWTSRTLDAGAVWSNAEQVSRTRVRHRPAGFVFPYGDYFGMTIDGSGTIYLTWSQGKSYNGPGSTWWSSS